MRFRGTRAELTAKLREIPAVLAGREPDPYGVHDLFWAHIGNAVLNALERDFRDKLAGGTGRFDGVKWAKLAAATLARREREGRGDDDILFETGALLASLAPGFDDAPNPAAPDQVFDVRPGGVEVGSADEKADWHENGVPGRLPKRTIVPPEPLPAAWEAELERAAEKAIVKVIERVCEAG